MGKICILLLEGKRTSNHLSLLAPLSRRYEVVMAYTSSQAAEAVHQYAPLVAVLNLVSMRTSGQRISRLIRSKEEDLPIIYIKKAEGKRAGKVTQFSDTDIILHQPFTPRKLYNRIERCMAAKDGEVLIAGPFRLNLKSRILLTNTLNEIRLTPKQSKLLELFMRRPNTILERRYLMEHVWDTDYLGDTRTLDVHIRWIREVLEEKPSKPIFLRTIRGKGYMLDINPDK